MTHITPATKCLKSINNMVYIIENRLFSPNHYFFSGECSLMCDHYVYPLKASIKIFINSLEPVVGKNEFHIVEQHDEKDWSPESPIRREGESWTTEA